MTKPNYLVEVRWTQINCLGEQLKEIVQSIELYSSIKNAIWYASDVLAVTIPPFIINFKEFTPKKAGNTHDLIHICQHVDQFLSNESGLLTNDENMKIRSNLSLRDEEVREPHKPSSYIITRLKQAWEA